jgi:hypothetical protein
VILDPRRARAIMVMAQQLDANRPKNILEVESISWPAIDRAYRLSLRVMAAQRHTSVLSQRVHQRVLWSPTRLFQMASRWPKTMQTRMPKIAPLPP